MSADTAAIRDLINTGTDSSTWGDVGPHFTCTEANTVAAALIRLNLDGFAAALIEGHAEGDEEGDQHWTGEASCYR